MTTTAIEAQLREELGSRLHALAVLAGPDATIDWPRALDARVSMLAGQLAAADDDVLAETVVDVMAALWPTGDPPPEWWRTPVGRRCAASLGAEDSAEVTHSVAAAMLGVARGGIGKMVARGDLERHPDGGVTRASVLLRLAR
jgi:hypothetical protein